MKKKTCKWLDSNEMGGLLLHRKAVLSCCCVGTAVFSEKNKSDFTALTKEEIQNARIKLQENINDDTTASCKGCPHLIEKEESEINVSTLSFLGVGTFNTCNLRCKYCGFTEEEWNEKLDDVNIKSLPIVKNFHNQGMLNDDINLSLSGGEPTLFDDIIETCQFLGENYKYPRVTIASNSTLSDRVEKLAEKMGELPSNLTKHLVTAFDAGTPETYKLIRGKDLFYDVVNNIITYAKNKSFDFYNLKYIFLSDCSNASDEDIFGFLGVVKLISQNYCEQVKIVIDRDFLSDLSKGFDERIIEAAGKMFYVAKEILGVSVISSGISDPNNKDIEKIYEFAQKYKTQKKSAKEQYFIHLLSAKNDILPEIDSALIRAESAVKKFIAANKGKKVYFYGAGEFAQKALEYFDFSSLNVQGVIDKDPKKRGSEICGYKIYSIDDVEKLQPETLVLTVLHKNLVMPSLEKLKTNKNCKFEIIHELFSCK